MATFETGIQPALIKEPANGPVHTHFIDTHDAFALSIGQTNATAINIGHSGLSIFAYGDSLFIGSTLDTINTSFLSLGGNATSVVASNSNISFGLIDVPWKDGYFISIHTNWKSTIQGSLLIVDSYMIKPTSGVHHVNAKNDVIINTIETSNLPINTTVELILIADEGNITLKQPKANSSNIKTHKIILQDTAQKLIWDGQFWYLVA